MELSPAVLEPGRVFVARVAAFLPSLFAALLVFLVGWLLAKTVRVLVFRFLLAVRFDVASEKAGIDDILVRADLRQSQPELVALLGQ